MSGHVIVLLVSGLPLYTNCIIIGNVPIVWFLLFFILLMNMLTSSFIIIITPDALSSGSWGFLCYRIKYIIIIKCIKIDTVGIKFAYIHKE